MGTRTRLVLALVVASLAADGARSQLPAPASAVAPGARAARLPLRFEANVGPGPAGVAFVARRAGALLTLSPRGATLRLAGPDGAPPAEVSLRVAGGRAVDPRGDVQLATRTSYFVGDPSTWRSNVPTYARVVYDDVLEGVDLVFHGANGALGLYGSATNVPLRQRALTAQSVVRRNCTARCRPEPQAARHLCAWSATASEQAEFAP
jgi:hypothetical protein